MRLSKTTLVCAILFMVAAGGAIVELTGNRTGSVEGVTIQNYAAVPANPYNQAAQQIEQKQAELQSRETALNQSANRQDRMLTYLFIVMGALLVLTIINFYLDFKRSHEIIAH